MSFEWPLALVGLFVVPALVGLYVLYDRRRRAYAARFANPALLAHVFDRTPGPLRHVPLALLLLALAAMVVGVARPHAMVTVQREDATVLLAVDVSRSMKAKDVRPTRLDAARKAATAFLDEVPPKFRVGVISFATHAVLASPPTDDRELAKTALRTLRPGEGTALGDAVALAARVGSRQRAGDGAVPPTAVLLISDGAAQGGRVSPQAAAKSARMRHVPVYTVLVGTENGTVTERLTGGFTERLRVPPKPATLRMIARATGGEFFTARSTDRLKEVYERLGSRLGHKRASREVTDLFAAGSAMLLVVGGSLSMLWFRRVP